MKLITCRDLKFYVRPGTSDQKTVQEVVQRKAYFKKGMEVKQGEQWFDCGANIGAFTVFAASMGADVTAIEPDPLSCEMIEKNLKLNRMKAKVINAALVHDNTKKALLHLGNNGNVWRNSLWKKWQDKNGAIAVNCVNFERVVPNFANVKMDIEGSEMPILEVTNRKFNYIAFEWSFDIDKSLPRFWKVVERLKQHHKIGMAPNTGRFITRDYDTWQDSWFPAAVMVWAYAKTGT